MRLLSWQYGVRNLARHRLRLLLGIGGSALVVLLVLAAAAFVRGMEASLRVAPDNRNVILLSAGSEESVERSEINASAGAEIAASIKGLKERLGVAYVSPEVYFATLVKEEEQTPQALLALLRGVLPEAFLVHSNVRITDGRAPGQNEMLVGRLAAAKMGLPEERLAIGQQLWLDNRLWTISGHFEAPGSVMEAELWVPLRDLQLASRRDSISCVVVTLDQAEFSDVELFCKQRRDLELVAIAEADYYGKLLEFYRPVQTIIWITAALIALGGLFGGLNLMYAAFAARVRELGMLQALGYSRLAIIICLAQESLLISAAGTLVAAPLALILLDGLAVRISMGAFGLVLDASVLLAGIAAALILGLAGALPPAWRCLRMPIAEALKAV